MLDGLNGNARIIGSLKSAKDGREVVIDPENYGIHLRSNNTIAGVISIQPSGIAQIQFFDSRSTTIPKRVFFDGGAISFEENNQIIGKVMKSELTGSSFLMNGLSKFNVNTGGQYLIMDLSDLPTNSTGVPVGSPYCGADGIVRVVK